MVSAALWALGLMVLPAVGSAQDLTLLEGPPKPYYDGLRLERPGPRAVYGYPALDDEPLEIAELLRAGAFAELEDRLDRLARSVREDIRRERHLSEAFRIFGLSDPEGEAALEAWAEAYPASPAPHLARARHQLATLRRWREDGRLPPDPMRYYAGENRLVGPEDEAYALVQRAQDALDRATEIDGTHFLRYLLAFEIAQQTGWRPELIRLLREATEQYPLSALIREEAAVNALPEWGGTVQIVRRIAQDAAGLTERNPRLATLAGMEYLAEARMEMVYLTLPGALAAQNRAVEQGETARFLVERAHTYFRSYDFVRSLEDLNRALELRPLDQEALQGRATALFQLAFDAPLEARPAITAAAREDYALMARLDPGDAAHVRGVMHTRQVADACATDAATCMEGYDPIRPERFVDGEWRGVGIVLRLAHDLGTLYRAFGLRTGLPLLVGFGSVFLLWRRSGYWLPRYVHFLALASLVPILYINWLWVSTGGPMWTRRYLVIAAFPLSVYFIFIMYGGLRGALRKHAPDSAGAHGREDSRTFADVLLALARRVWP